MLQRALKKQLAPEAQADLQAQTHHRILRQHLADLDQALADGQLSPVQHAAARDDVMRQVLSDTAMGQGSGGVASLARVAHAPVRVAWIVLSLTVLSGLTYLHWALPTPGGQCL